MPRPAAAVLLALTSLAVAAPAAPAAKLQIGSNLQARATIAEKNPNDWAAWPTTLAEGGGNLAVPVQGAVVEAQFKGTVLRPQGYDAPFHFMVSTLRPQSDGSYYEVVTSKFLDFPVNGDDQRITTFNLNETEADPNLCVLPGDVVALTTSGGFGTPEDNPIWGEAGGQPGDYLAGGHPVQMFARVSGSTTAVSKEPSGGFDRTVPPPQQRVGEELLMRVTIGTGADAPYSCRSATETQSPTASFPTQAFRLKLAQNKVGVQLACVSLAPCKGALYLKLGATTPVGTGPFEIAGGQAGTVPVTVNANGLRKLKERKGRMQVTAIAKVAGGKKIQRAFKLVR